MSARLFSVVFAITAVVALSGLPLDGSPDMPEFRVWTHAAATSGPSQVYGTGNVWGREPLSLEYAGRTSYVQYPPLTIDLLAVVGRAYQAIFPTFPETRALTIAVKLPGLLAALGISLLLFRIVTLHYGANTGRLAALAYWANPAVVLNGPFLGYLDPLVSLPALAAIVAAASGSAVWSGVLFALACLTKPQGIFIAPGLVLALGALSATPWRQWRNAGAGAAVTTAVVLLPVIRARALGNMLFALRGLANDGMLSGNAANIWWVYSYVTEVARHVATSGMLAALQIDTQILKMSETVLPGRSIAGHGAGGFLLMSSTWLAFSLIIAILMWRARRTPGLPAAAGLCAVTVHAYFVLVVQVHENHMALILPFVAFLAATDAGYRPLFYLLSGIIFFNLNMFYGLDGHRYAWRDLPGPIDLTVVLAIINICALAWHVRVFARRLASPAAKAVAHAESPLL